MSEAARTDGGGVPALALLAQPLPADERRIVCLDAAVLSSSTGLLAVLKPKTTPMWPAVIVLLT